MVSESFNNNSFYHLMAKYLNLLFFTFAGLFLRFLRACGLSRGRRRSFCAFGDKCAFEAEVRIGGCRWSKHASSQPLNPG
jgi:hypothetical protein